MTDVRAEFEKVRPVIEVKQAEVRQRRPYIKEPVTLKAALRSTGISYLERISELPESEEQRRINHQGLQEVKARLAEQT